MLSPAREVKNKQIHGPTRYLKKGVTKETEHLTKKKPGRIF